MEGGGSHDWSAEGVKEEEETSLRRRRARWPSPPASPNRPGRILTARGGATSVRTRRRGPTSPDVSPRGDSSPGSVVFGSSDEEDVGVEGILASLRAKDARPRLLPPQDSSTASSSSFTGGAGGGGGGGGARLAVGSFSFPQVVQQPNVDAAQVLDLFAAMEAERKAKARSEFLDQTMGTTVDARTLEIKKALLLGRKVVDLAGLERWLRRVEAVADLAWFTELCSDDDDAKAVPPLDLFDCAFRSLEGAWSDELHRRADPRKHWIGSVPVPEFFLCPVSNKLMEDPVVITSGKTVDRSALEKWWNKHKRICPVTDEALAHSILIPNILIAMCISLWRATNGIADVATCPEPPNISPDEEALFKEITLLAHSPSISNEAYVAILRLDELVNKDQCSLLHLLGRSPGTIAKLACILPETCLDPDPELDDIILKIMAKVASYIPNKEVLGDDQYAIPVLIARALLGPVATRVKCAHILGLLADNYYNKIKIGELGGFAALMELLLVGDIDVKKTVAMAIASLCEAQENRSRFIREGVADAAISLLREDGLVDEARSMLLQAGGFELAMMQITDKLMAFGADTSCKKMAQHLWENFIRSEPKQMHAAATASKKAFDTSSETSSEESIEFAADDSVPDQTKKDVKTIVSWLQKRSQHPRTYRYRK